MFTAHLSADFAAPVTPFALEPKRKTRSVAPEEATSESAQETPTYECIIIAPFEM